ncbi:uncharacterized protein BDR25DRAFT_310394 [Lindgomyces ingoldianus]|uniref:Uncharacterized protein n=1 Tax=Lindgomyces ingoldianus TaxID=673940 RepID=A0ACB6RCC1_9PLEO|nr:uncharacterized protein BDR25DRAFT_310394 [Lindgomyces ingoldianus]KAF2475972.1 hypothetical protein BDR25DRAFT_310394 [Lindgomyces ingoldianus]
MDQVPPARLLSDPTTICDVVSRRWDFPRPSKSYKLLEAFGPCISTADSDNCARHCKVLATPFNESIMSLVWSESLQQAQDMTSTRYGKLMLRGRVCLLLQTLQNLSSFNP